MSIWGGIALYAWLMLQTAAFTCPMHTEVTSGLPGSCPKCGMALTRRPDPAAAEYDLGVKTVLNGTRLRLQLTLARADGSIPSPFIITHERELHLFVIRQDLTSFAHVHPDRVGAGSYSVNLDDPTPGEYRIFADFVPTDAPPQLLQQTISIAGRGRVRTHRPAGNAARTVQTAGGMRIALEAEEVRVGTPALLTFTFADPETGAAIEDLEPFLGAAGHLFFTDPDFQMASHSHPLEEPRSARVRFLVRFPDRADFRIWLQVQRRGEVTTTEWTITVPAD
jgi:hypothetical protein